MSEKKISREEFDKLWRGYLELARNLREKDRHGRGGTTFGEMIGSQAFAEAWIGVLTDPEYIRREVAQRLERWLGERGGKYSDDGWLEKEGLGPGIAKLGATSRGGKPFPHPLELGQRAARAPSMTAQKAEQTIKLLRENATLCNALAEAFEERLKAEGGIRRIQ